MRFSNSANNDSKYSKRPPAYFETLHHYPFNNPLFIAVDWESLHWIHRLRGLCLLCNQWPGNYDLSCCFDREVWVLHSSREDLSAALRLAQAVQYSGATEIVVIQLGHEKARG
jgi:hypothetical protein